MQKVEKRLFQIYANQKEGKIYQLDRDTLEVYVLPIDIKGISERSGNYAFIFVMIGLPVIGFLLEPLRYYFYLDINIQVKVFMIAITLLAHTLLGIFFERIVNKIKVNRDKKNTVNRDKKLKDGFIKDLIAKLIRQRAGKVLNNS